MEYKEYETENVEQMNVEVRKYGSERLWDGRDVEGSVEQRMLNIWNAEHIIEEKVCRTKEEWSRWIMEHRECTAN